MNIPSTSTDLILHNGTVTTLDRSNPSATAVAIRDGKFLRVGTEADVMPLAGAATRVIDVKGRRVLPGLIDNHLHIIRAGLSFNLELRWDGVRSLADAMEMLKRQIAVTPPPQWVRVVGGGFQNYPDDYAVIRKLDEDRQLTIRLAYNLFTQKPKGETEDFLHWVKTSTYKQGNDYFRHNGAGEMLVFSAADFEDFRQPRPDMPPEMERELEEVVRILATNRWPWRLHATYDETISRALDIYERVARDIPFDGLNWFFDHAETISERSMDRIAALGGGIAVQHRMAYQGEYFVERYGSAAASATPPFARMLAKGIHVSAGTDATRFASYNPWVSLAWLVTGTTVGGLRIYPQRNCLDRETALRMWTENVTWFSNEEGKKGQIKVGQLADLVVPDRDYFSCPESEIADITAALTVVGGKVVYGAGEFARVDEAAPPPALPDWSPVRRFGGYAAPAERKRSRTTAAMRRTVSVSGRARAGHVHDFTCFWGALGCACWSV